MNRRSPAVIKKIQFEFFVAGDTKNIDHIHWQYGIRRNLWNEDKYIRTINDGPIVSNEPKGRWDHNMNGWLIDKWSSLDLVIWNWPPKRMNRENYYNWKALKRKGSWEYCSAVIPQKIFWSRIYFRRNKNNKNLFIF